MNYFLIPGNPPAVHFYEQWAKEIEESQPDSVAVVSPYPQVSPDMNSEEAMDYIYRTHEAQLKSFRTRVKGDISLIGHSLGGHFGLRLLQNNPLLIHKAFLVFPFLREPTREGKFVLGLANAIAATGGLTSLILKTRPAMVKVIPELAFVSDAELRNAAAIARHEKHTIARDRSEFSVDEDLKKKIVIFHTKNDWWCNQEFIGTLEGLQREVCSEPHSFVSVLAHRSGIFRKCEESFKES